MIMNKKWVQPLMGILAGALAGVLIMELTFSSDIDMGIPILSFLVSLAMQVIVAVLAYYLHIILHEGGHLIFGLISGYRFTSFRIARTMLVKTPKGLQAKAMQLNGTLGQCLMAPPEYKEGQFPYKLYNYGGILMNFLTAVVCTGIYLLRKSSGAERSFLLLMTFVGLALAIMNWVPINNGAVLNDGANVACIKDDPLAAKAFWTQLAMNAASVQGKRLKDMPEEWFELPQDADMHNIAISSVGVFKAQRQLDLHDFKEARREIQYLISDRCTLNGIYDIFLRLDLFTIDMLEKKGRCDASLLKDRAMIAFMETMDSNPAVLRVQYLHAKLVKRNDAEAMSYRNAFETIADTYPSAGDIESERELMNLGSSLVEKTDSIPVEENALTD